MNLRALRLRWLLDRRVGLVLLWAGLVLVAVVVNLVGVHIVGSIEGWSQWLERQAGFFLAWRLCLYGLTGWGWWRMRQRLRARDASVETRNRLLRTEIAAVLAIALLEGSTLLRSA